jgi:hypothetical protein
MVVICVRNDGVRCFAPLHMQEHLGESFQYALAQHLHMIILMTTQCRRSGATEPVASKVALLISVFQCSLQLARIDAVVAVDRKDKSVGRVWALSPGGIRIPPATPSDDTEDSDSD